MDEAVNAAEQDPITGSDNLDAENDDLPDEPSDDH